MPVRIAGLPVSGFMTVTYDIIEGGRRGSGHILSFGPKRYADFTEKTASGWRRPGASVLKQAAAPMNPQLWQQREMNIKRKANTARRCRKMTNGVGKEGSQKPDGCAEEGDVKVLAKSLPCAVYSSFFGRMGPMTFISKEWEVWTGYTSDELCADPEMWPKCIHPDDRARALSSYEIACRDEVPYSLEYRVINRHTGEIRHVRDQGLLSDDRETDLVRVDGIVTDVTELKKLEDELASYRDQLEEMVAERTAELLRANEVLRIEDTERRKVLAALTKSEERFRAIFDNVTDVICYLDTKGTVLEVNKRIEHMLGYTPEEVTGKNFASIGVLSAAELPRMLRLFKDTILTGKPVSPLELQLKHKDGATVTAEIGTKFITQNGRVKGIVTILKDVTEHRRAEHALTTLNRELKAAVQKLTAANRELVDFAHIAAHDLKAPLRGIGSLAGIISAEYNDALGHEGRELLRMLVGRASRMYSHIDGILRYSQIGRTAEEKRRINLYELVGEIVASLAPPEHIDISVSKRLPSLVCDKTRMIQVFQNLLDNAIKYTDKPRGRIRVDCTKEDGFWMFSIADNGCGISEKYFDKIFKIFQTLASRDEVESTGIGLSVVKKIVEISGGRIWVESQVGEGTTFYFTLPR